MGAGVGVGVGAGAELMRSRRRDADWCWAIQLRVRLRQRARFPVDLLDEGDVGVLPLGKDIVTRRVDFEVVRRAAGREMPSGLERPLGRIDRKHGQAVVPTVRDVKERAIRVNLDLRTRA
jgi:hypothetical protein